LTQSISEIQGAIHNLEVENEQLREAVEGLRKREEELREELESCKYAATLALKRANESDQYQRRNNLRIYGIPEPVADPKNPHKAEAEDDIERKVLEMFTNKLQVSVKPGDVEAVHRLGKPGRKGGEGNAPRGVIVRFVNRKQKELVIKNRKKLKNTRMVIVEDLTDENYRLYRKVKENDLCKHAWTVNGKTMMETISGRVVHVQSLSHLNENRVVWAKEASKKSGGK
jgi:hypothetical protein